VVLVDDVRYRSVVVGLVVDFVVVVFFLVCEVVILLHLNFLDSGINRDS